MEQWCSKIAMDVVALKNAESHVAMAARIEHLYTQADVNADPASALASIDQIIQDPQAYAALQAMKEAYSERGSPDLTPEEIRYVYSDALRAAAAATEVPTDILVEMIWTESKGHPLVSKYVAHEGNKQDADADSGLTQLDCVAWGQMADRDPRLKNRYLPMSNIVAAAMYLADVKKRHGCMWEYCYEKHYRYPNLRIQV